LTISTPTYNTDINLRSITSPILIGFSSFVVYVTRATLSHFIET